MGRHADRPIQDKHMREAKFCRDREEISIAVAIRFLDRSADSYEQKQGKKFYRDREVSPTDHLL